MKRALCLLFSLLLLSACASTPEPADENARAGQLYASAQSALERGDYSTAVSRLESLEARYPFGTYAEQAQLDIIYAYHKMDEAESAVAAADRFVRLNPRHPRVDYAWYMKGVAEQESGDDFLGDLFDLDRAARDPEPLRQAFEAFRTLVQRHPDSEYVADARERMTTLRDQLARHELMIARFYADRQAWVAAANRATGLVRDYEGTPALVPALQLLERAYGELEIPELREDIRRILRANGINTPERT